VDRQLIGTEPIEVHAEDRELLIDVVVQFTGDASTFGLLLAEQPSAKVADAVVAGAQAGLAAAQLALDTLPLRPLHEEPSDEGRLHQAASRSHQASLVAPAAVDGKLRRRCAGDDVVRAGCHARDEHDERVVDAGPKTLDEVLAGAISEDGADPFNQGGAPGLHGDVRKRGARPSCTVPAIACANAPQGIPAASARRRASTRPTCTSFLAEQRRLDCTAE
jgi:hypothetical protein